MPYTVVHTLIAEKALARLSLPPGNCKAVAIASNKIDQLLKTKPEQVGQPFGVMRLLRIPPLDVLYHVSPDDMLVTIHSYRLMP